MIISSQLPLCRWLRSGPVEQRCVQRWQRERHEEIKETVVNPSADQEEAEARDPPGSEVLEGWQLFSL